MTIFMSNLKRIFKKRTNRIVIFVVPILFMLLAFNINFGGSISVSLVDKDNTELTKALIKGLEGRGKVTVVSEDSMRTAITNKTSDFGIMIEKGFADSVINEEDVKVKTYKAEGANAAAAEELYVENYISAVKNISKVTNGDKELFNSALKEYEKGNFTSEISTIGAKGEDSQRQKTALGVLGYVMLLIASFSTNLIMEDKKNNTYIRMFASPLKNWNYMLQNICSFFAVILIQIIIAFEFMTVVYKNQLGPSLSNIFIVFVVYAASCVALGLAVTSVSKNIKQASVLGLLLNTLIGMFGGLFWPKEYMPDFMITIGKFTPAYWLKDAMDKMLTSSSITAAALDIGIIALFTLVFFMISSWGKVYTENV